MTIHLLKNKSEDLSCGSRDPYEVHLPQPHFIPVLDYVEVNAGKVYDCLCDDCPYNSLIVTSQRALDALRTVLSKMDSPKSLLRLPVYTVGPATASRLDALGFDRVYGRDTGNGDVLSRRMVEELKEQHRFLFLAGEIHRPLIRERLEKAGHTVETVIVYRTEKISYQQDLQMHVKPNDWIVFFSPSGSDEACAFVKDAGYKIKVAAIGPTTEAYLKSKGVEVHCTAKLPSPESLAECMKEIP